MYLVRCPSKTIGRSRCNDDELSRTTVMQEGMNYPQEHGDIDLDRFFRDHQRPLERYLRSRIIGLTPEEVEDLAAEVMCQFVAYCTDHPGGIALPRALMFTIARSRIADYFNRRARVREISLEDAPPIAARGSIMAVIDADDDLRSVHAALASMREEYREVITLHAIVGLEMKEIAEMLEKSETNIRVLLFRARRTLRKTLRVQHPDRYAEPNVDQS